MIFKLVIPTLILLLFLPLVFATPPATGATSIAVTTTDPRIIPDGQCSLREALANAAAKTALYTDCAPGAEQNIIELVEGKTYTLDTVDNTDNGPNGLPVIISEVTINGRGAVIERGEREGTPEFRFFQIGQNGSLALKNLTLRNGHLSGKAGGAAIFNLSGNLSLENVTINGNRTESEGGAIFNLGRQLTITGGAFLDNRAASGGAISNLATLNTLSGSITGTTFAGNRASNAGGALSLVAVWGKLDFKLSNLTLAGNGSGGQGGGIYHYLIFGESKVSLEKTRLAGNTALSGANCYGPFINAGGNLQSGPANSCGPDIEIGNPPLAPVIITQPVNRIINRGQYAGLAVTAYSSLPVSYQWYNNHRGDLSGLLPIKTARTTDLFTLPLVESGSYWVRLTNAYGSTDSDEVTVTVNQPPVIITQPLSLTLNRGQLASLRVIATSTTPLTYQWYSGISGDTRQPIKENNNPDFISPALIANTAYWVRVSNQAGSVDSQTAQITVNQPPTFITQPVSVTISSGQSATFKVSIDGTGPFFYQWYSGKSGELALPFKGATGPSFSTPNLTATLDVWVQVSNLAGKTDSITASAEVKYPPVINSQPDNPLLNPGQSASLKIVATGSEPLSYQWYRGHSGETANPIQGATGPTYTTPALQKDLLYWVRVKNAAGSIDSETGLVAVNQPPTIVTQPVAQVLNRGQVATLKVEATGAGPLAYQWYKGKRGDTSQPVNDGDNSTLLSSPLTADTLYWVRVSNIVGQIDSQVAPITVRQPPVITSQAVSQTITPGKTVTLKITVEGTGPFHYTWYQGETDDVTNPVRDYDADTYTTPALSRNNAYWVRVSGVAGTVKSQTYRIFVGSPAPATANPPPVIKTQPLDQQISYKETARLVVEISEGEGITYQWYTGRSGDTTNPLPGATGATLLAPPSEENRYYWVRISSKTGTVDSRTVRVKVVNGTARGIF